MVELHECVGQGAGEDKSGWNAAFRDKSFPSQRTVQVEVESA